MSWRHALPILLLLAAPLNPGCLCSGNGHVEQKPFVARIADNVVNCNCNLSFHNDSCTDTGGSCYAHLGLQLCLPPALNADTIGNPAAAAALAALPPAEFAQRVDAYCRETVTKIVYHTIKVFNGGWCDYKKPFALDGGVGSSVDCFAQPIDDSQSSATARDTSVCTHPCNNVPCDDKINCGKGVQDSTGNIHLDKCNCNQIIYDYTCPGDPPSDIPTPTFCKPATDVKPI